MNKKMMVMASGIALMISVLALSSAQKQSNDPKPLRACFLFKCLSCDEKRCLSDWAEKQAAGNHGPHSLPVSLWPSIHLDHEYDKDCGEFFVSPESCNAYMDDWIAAGRPCQDKNKRGD